MPLHCTMVDAGRQIGGYPIRQYKPPPYPPFLWTDQAAIRQDVEIWGLARSRVGSLDFGHPQLIMRAAALLAETLGEQVLGIRRIIGPGVLHHGRMSLGLFRADNRSWRRRMSRLVVNGKTHDVDADPNTPLLWVLREQIGLTGTKYGCGIAQCGACTVHIDGAAVRSCSLPVSAAEGKQITTIEGLAKNGTLHPVQKAWLEHDVPQCGYCQTGMIMAVAALLNEKPKPTDADIDNTITNICRCGTFQQVREAIHAATSA